MLHLLAEAVFPSRCAGCRRPGTTLCPTCAAQLRPAPAASPPAPLEWWTACFAYEGVAREIVARAKYRGERAALRELAPRLGEAVGASPIAFDVVTWAPASRPRYAEQGVDHAAVLARIVARARNVPVRRLLTRADGIPQTGRVAADRRVGPQLLVVGKPRDLTVLVVDDVATTGGTLAAAARVLRERGARAVAAATIARTPRPGEASRIHAYTSPTTLVDAAEAAWTSSSSASTRKSMPH